MAAAARAVIADGPAGAHRVATALSAYWEIALAPHWDRMRSVLEADIAYRARQAALSGISTGARQLLRPHRECRGTRARISWPRNRTTPRRAGSHRSAVCTGRSPRWPDSAEPPFGTGSYEKASTRFNEQNGGSASCAL